MTIQFNRNTTTAAAHCADQIKGKTVLALPKLGQVQGRSLDDGVRQFHVPYATVPKRWRAAKPVTPWSGILDASQPRPECPQPAHTFFVNDEPTVKPVYDEVNCLNLDIITPPPSKDGRRLLPCLVWIHGGGFKNKFGGAEVYDATRFIQYSVEIGSPVLIISITYRLGGLGSFASSDMKKEAEEDGETIYGNWGIEDNVLAFHWIKDNIQHFGGDPNQLTAFGESSGSMILHHLLLRENPPFTRAILQSGVVGVGGPVPVTYHDAAWKELQEHFNVTTVEEMRNVPAMELCQKLTDLGNEFYPPVSDGAICENPLKQYTAQGSYNTLDALIIGDMTDEGTLYSRVQPAVELYQEYEKRVPSELLDDFHALYPPQNLETPETARAMLDSLASVILFQYPIDRTANAVAELNPNTRLYRYRFDFGLEVTQASGLGKHHGADILYTFLNRHLTDSELRIAKKLVTHWIMFAYDRNLEQELGWKRYDTQSRLCFVYGENGNELQSISKSQDLEKYQFWQLVEETKVRSSIV